MEIAWGRCGGTCIAGRRHVGSGCAADTVYLHITYVAYDFNTSDVIVLHCPILSLDGFKAIASSFGLSWHDTQESLHPCFTAFLPGSTVFSLGWRCLLLVQYC